MVMTTYSMFYTGTKAHLIKRGDGDFVMQPNESKLIVHRLLENDSVIIKVELSYA